MTAQKKSQKGRGRITVDVGRQEADYLAWFAKKHGISVAEVVRAALHEYPRSAPKQTSGFAAAQLMLWVQAVGMSFVECRDDLPSGPAKEKFQESINELIVWADQIYRDHR